MGINFPVSIVVGDVFNAAPGLSYVRVADTEVPSGWKRAPMNTALPGNKIVNPAMQHSQQNGDTGSFLDNYMVADQWRSFTNIAGNIFAFGRSTGPNPRGNAFIYASTSTAKPTLTAGDACAFRQNIEGRRVADLKWGTTAAEQAVLAFWFVSSRGGEYSIAIKNADNTRSYVAGFSVPASGWHYREIVIPGDTTGTWLTDTGIGMTLDFYFASGSTWNVAANGWYDGHKRALTTISNGADTVGNVFYLADVGLYRDPYKTGVAPEWETPDHQLELRRCKRYWQKLYGLRGGRSTATSSARLGGTLLPPMRAAPSYALVGTNQVFDGAVTANISAITVSSGNEFSAELDVSHASIAYAAYPSIQYYLSDGIYIAANARM